MKRKLISLTLALCMVVSMFAVGIVPAAADTETYETYAQETVQGSAILHCFNWSYNNIKAALPDIAKAGYTAVQTSPVQQPKDYNASWTDTSGQWSKLYQPLGFKVATGYSWLGTKSELTALCTEAEKYNIKVIVDIVSNHLANNGTSGGTYDYLNPGVDSALKNSDCYHTENIKANSQSRYNMTQHHIGMPDLNTSNSFVQQQVLDLLKECVDCGVDGFRFDAAKHIELPTDPDNCKSDFWPTVINGINDYVTQNNKDDLYLYGEILNDAGTSISNYTNYFAVTDNYTGDRALYYAYNKNAQNLADSTYYKGARATYSVLWAESHDTYMNDDSGSAGIPKTTVVGDDDIVKAWAIVGSRANSTALFFARPNDTMGAASTDTTWKSKAVTEVNKFKSRYNGTNEKLAYSGNVAYIERGTSGNAGVVISKLDGAGSVSLTTAMMAPGDYTDQVTGSTFTVANNTITGTVGSTGVAVVYRTSDPLITNTRFYLTPNTTWKTCSNFAMYLYGDGTDNNTWVKMDPVDSSNSVYYADVPEGSWTHVIFCAMDSGTLAWSAKKYQTSDLYPETGTDCYTVASGTQSYGGGTWSLYGGETPTEAPTDPTSGDTITVYAYNKLNNWSNLKVYYWGSSSDPDWPGVDMQNGGTVYSAVIPRGVTGVIFSGVSNSSRKQSVDIITGINDRASWVIKTTTTSGKYDVEAGPTYYLVGSMNGWSQNDEYAFELNASNTENIEYKLSEVELSANAELKVKDSKEKWYPSSSESSQNYIVERSGLYDVYFRPNKDGAGDWFNGYFYLDNVTPINVTWMNGTTPLLSDTVLYGGTPEYTGETPTKEGDAQYSYTFSGWSDGNNIYGVDDPLPPATADVTYTAQYTRSLNSYTVTFANQDGTVLQSSEFDYGETPVYSGNTPTKAADFDNTYTFAGWDREITTVTGDVTYTATYTATARKYFSGNSLTLKGEIGVNFFVDLRGASPDSAAVTLSWYQYEKSYPLSELTPDPDTGWYKVTCFVAAKEINDDITAVLTVDGTEVATDTYSVAKYAYRIIDNEGGEFDDMFPDDDTKLGRLQELCKAMLHYGAKAQTFFDHNTENPADSKLVNYSPAEIDPDDLDPIDHAGKLDAYGLTYVGSSLLLKDTTTLRLFFTTGSGYDGTTVSYDNKTLTPGVRKNYVYYDISGIKAADIMKDFTVTFTNGDSSVTEDFNVSNYIASKLNDATINYLMTALYNYNVKAVAYYG